jgi:hypothetical protein
MQWDILEDREAVTFAATSSQSVGQAVDKLGITRGGKAYRKFREACDKFGLDYSYPNRLSVQRTPLAQILVEDSPYTNNRINVKRYVLEAGLLKNECTLCGLGPVWNGLPIVLQLDHINGVNNDHRIENLRILCPNCHTQTETFAGKRRGND